VFGLTDAGTANETRKVCELRGACSCICTCNDILSP
jgi:hypothetical protein